MVEVVWLSEAQKALGSIHNWYLTHMGRRAANKFRDNVVKHVKYLVANPKLGKYDGKIIASQPDFRVLIVGKKHRIIYFLQSEIIYIAYIESCRQELR